MIKTAAEIAFLAVIFSLAFMQPKLESYGGVMTLTEPVFLLAALLFGVALVSRQASLSFDRVFILFATYCVGLLLSAMFSENRYGSLFKFAGELYLIGLAVLTFNIVRTQAMLKKVVLVWLVASGVSALIATLAVVFFYLGISNFLTAFAFHFYGSLPPGNYVRIQGTFAYPSMLCNYMTVSLMMLLAARKLDWISRPIAIAFGALFSITIAFTVTPGIGGVLFALGWWCYLVFRQLDRPGIARVVFVCGTLALMVFVTVSMLTVTQLATSSFSFSVGDTGIHATHRLLTWVDAARVFVAHPIFGRGVGLGVAEVYVYTPSDTVELLTDAHNTFLSIAGQAGIVGLVPLILICIAVVRRSLPFDLTDANTLRTALGIAFVSAFLIQGLVGSFEDARHLWVLMGLILSPSFTRPPEETAA